MGLRRTISLCNRICAITASIFLFFMMLLISLDVAGRLLVSKGVPTSIELSSLFLVVLVFLGISYAEEIKSHIRVELLTTRTEGRGRILLETLALLVMLVFFGLIAWEGLLIALDSWGYKEYLPGVVPIPAYPARFVLVFGCLLICVQIIIHLIETWQRWPDQKSVEKEDT